MAYESPTVPIAWGSYGKRGIAASVTTEYGSDETVPFPSSSDDSDTEYSPTVPITWGSYGIRGIEAEGTTEYVSDATVLCSSSSEDSDTDVHPEYSPTVPTAQPGELMPKEI